MSLTRRALLRGVLASVGGTALWTTQVHHLFDPAMAELDPDGALSARTEALLRTVLHRLESGEHRTAQRRVNPEWDLIERFVACLALADVALRLPERRGVLAGVVGRVSADLERAASGPSGQQVFLLPYGHHGGWRGEGRSLFVDGELAVVHGLAVLLGNRDALEPLRRRAGHVRRAMDAGPVLSGESYPNECWTFCNTAALLALRLAEVVDGQDHRAFRAAWADRAATDLVDGEGRLVSAYTLEGHPTQPAEGSSLWWSAHALRASAPALAKAQYALARQDLARTLMGFGWAREWPPDVAASPDIDSGGVVPLVEASPASSGWALVAARSFGDRELHRKLLASVGLAGFVRTDRAGRARLLAGNPVGDAVALYGLVCGPVFRLLEAA